VRRAGAGGERGAGHEMRIRPHRGAADRGFPDPRRPGPLGRERPDGVRWNARRARRAPLAAGVAGASRAARAGIVHVAWIGLLAGGAVAAAVALQAVRLTLGRLAMLLPGEVTALLITLAGLLGTIGLALGFLLFAVFSLEHLRSGARRG